MNTCLVKNERHRRVIFLDVHILTARAKVDINFGTKNEFSSEKLVVNTHLKFWWEIIITEFNILKKNICKLSLRNFQCVGLPNQSWSLSKPQHKCVNVTQSFKPRFVCGCASRSTMIWLRAANESVIAATPQRKFNFQPDCAATIKHAAGGLHWEHGAMKLRQCTLREAPQRNYAWFHRPLERSGKSSKCAANSIAAQYQGWRWLIAFCANTAAG